MNKKIRLYFSDKIQSDLVAHLKKEQSHYLKDVMRLKVGIHSQFLIAKENGKLVFRIMKNKELKLKY